jgi:hypothetical protein
MPNILSTRWFAGLGFGIFRKLFYHSTAEVQVLFPHITELFSTTIRAGDVIAIHPGDILGSTMPETFAQGQA